jgi:hypothetical protein
MRRFQKLAVLLVIFNLSVPFLRLNILKAEEEAAFSPPTLNSPSSSEESLLSNNPRPKPFGEGPFKIFNVYTDAKALDNHYSPSGMMGDTWDIFVDEKSTTRPHSGASCIKVVYNKKASLGARWAGVYWQDPKANWGSIPGGFNLTGAKQLTFWARGEKGDEKIAQFKVGGMSAQYGDSDSASISNEILTTDWQKFTIDLAGKDLSVICGGFCFTANLDNNPEGAAFYLDDIRFE